MKPLKIFTHSVYTVLQWFFLIGLLDLLTFGLFTQLTEIMFSVSSHLSRWRVMQLLLTTYVVFRAGMFIWRRVKVTKRLREKKKDLLEKRLSLMEKFRNIQVTNWLGDRSLGALSVSELRELIRSQKVTTVDILDAFQNNALELSRAHPGCVAEVIYDAEVDANVAAGMVLLEENFENPHSLMGIPVAVTEIFPLRNSDHTMGYVCRTKRPADLNCAFVGTLKDTGMVPFVLTSFRQKLLGLSQDNPVYGLATHPTHKDRVCVSGEAAFLFHGGCSLAFGADILGEARLAAAFCGLCSFKSTVNRFSQTGLDLPIPISSMLGVVPSPIGRQVTDLVDALRALWSQSAREQDPLVCPLPFVEEKYARVQSTGLRIGYYTGFPELLPKSAAMERMIEEAKAYLESKGHELIEVELPSPDKAFQLAINVLTSTMEPSLLRLVYKEGHGDVMVDHKQRALHLLYALPQTIRKQICYWRAKKVESHYPVTALALRALSCSLSESDLTKQVEDYRRSFDYYWSDCELDCLICPVSPVAAPLQNSGFYTVNMVLLYTCIYNMLGYPAGTVPFGAVERRDIEATKDLVKSEENNPSLLEFSQQFDLAEGLPIGIQVVSKPWNDELCLGLMDLLEQR